VVSKENFFASCKCFKHKTFLTEAVLCFDSNGLEVKVFMGNVRNVRFHFHMRLVALNWAVYEVHSESKFNGWPLEKFHRQKFGTSGTL
jgi:hypothetical protein